MSCTKVRGVVALTALAPVTVSRPWDPAPGHNSTVVSACVPDGAYVPAWRYLAGS